MAVGLALAQEHAASLELERPNHAGDGSTGQYLKSLGMDEGLLPFPEIRDKADRNATSIKGEEHPTATLNATNASTISLHTTPKPHEPGVTVVTPYSALHGHQHQQATTNHAKPLPYVQRKHWAKKLRMATPDLKYGRRVDKRPVVVAKVAKKGKGKEENTTVKEVRIFRPAQHNPFSLGVHNLKPPTSVRLGGHQRS